MVAARQPRPAAHLRTYRVPWAELLRKALAVDALACPECRGRMHRIAFIASETVARRILDHLGPSPPRGILGGARAHDVQGRMRA